MNKEHRFREVYSKDNMKIFVRVLKGRVTKWRLQTLWIFCDRLQAESIDGEHLDYYSVRKSTKKRIVFIIKRWYKR